MTNYWLLKTEPTSFSIDDLKREKKTAWSGVRNYQARNFMRVMAVGDLALFYHSSTGEPGIVGVAKVVRAAYPDSTQFDTNDSHYDPKATTEKPIWEHVDVAFVLKFKNVLPLTHLKDDHFFDTMPVTAQGSRLSVQPVAEKHFLKILKMSEAQLPDRQKGK